MREQENTLCDDNAMQALGDKAIIASQHAHGNFGAMADMLSSYALPEQASDTSRVASARKGQDSQGLRCRISNMNDALLQHSSPMV